MRVRGEFRVPESLVFHFEGRLADQHRMNFYEASRFQYAAARLIVKLAQFRKTGKFVKNITESSNFSIEITAQSDGSFNINIEDPGLKKDEEAFVKVSIADLIAFVSERLVEKIDENTSRNLRVEGAPRRVRRDASQTSGPTDFDQIVESTISGQQLPANLPADVKDLIRRRVAEIFRERSLEENKGSISLIDVARGQKLIAMAAPLISEMATGLRRSADTLEVTSTTHARSRSVLFLDQKMAKDIETARVDKEITPILGDVTQFNKDNGWVKFKTVNETRVISFSVPSDILPMIRRRLIDSMQKDMVHLQTYCVRDRSSEIVRLIVVGILPTPEQ